MREEILRGADWVAIAHIQKEGAFGSQAAEQTELRRRSLLSSLDALCAMEPDQQVSEMMISVIIVMVQRPGGATCAQQKHLRLQETSATA